ncbi:MAG: helix-turn-helix domain-containing protein [Mediterraneibacter faecis]
MMTSGSCLMQNSVVQMRYMSPFINRQTVSNWENGKSYPDLQILVSMSNQFSSHPVLFKIK